MAQPYLSLQRAKELVVELVKNSPAGKKNPENKAGSCLYDDGHGNHCIGGEVLFQMGIPIPDPEDNFKSLDMLGYYVEKSYMSQATLEYLTEIQRVFDGRDDDLDWETPTWRGALKVCRKQGLL